MVYLIYILRGGMGGEMVRKDEVEKKEGKGN